MYSQYIALLLSLLLLLEGLSLSFRAEQLKKKIRRMQERNMIILGIMEIVVALALIAILLL